MHLAATRARACEHSPARVDSPGAWVDSRDRAGSDPYRTPDRAGGPSSQRVNPRLDGRSPTPTRAHPHQQEPTTARQHRHMEGSARPARAHPRPREPTTACDPRATPRARPIGGEPTRDRESHLDAARADAEGPPGVARAHPVVLKGRRQAEERAPGAPYGRRARPPRRRTARALAPTVGDGRQHNRDLSAFAQGRRAPARRAAAAPGRIMPKAESVRRPGQAGTDTGWAESAAYGFTSGTPPTVSMGSATSNTL